jgi:hypothetical protein
VSARFRANYFQMSTRRLLDGQKINAFLMDHGR